MKVRRSFIHFGLGTLVMLTALVCAMSTAAANTGTEPKARDVKHKKMGISDYQNFLKNWDEMKDAALYAQIQTPAQYATLFHPAPLMGAKRPFAPEAALYDQEQILLVARVVPAPDNMNRVFEVERVIEMDRQVELHYKFNAPNTNATFSVKNYLAVRIPKHDYAKVVFVENGKQIGELDTAKGQWSVPEMAPESNKADKDAGK